MTKTLNKASTTVSNCMASLSPSAHVFTYICKTVKTFPLAKNRDERMTRSPRSVQGNFIGFYKQCSKSELDLGYSNH